MNTSKWTTAIDLITADFKEQFGNLTILQLNWTPDNKHWSVAQNIEHLIIINKTYFPVIDQLRKGEYQRPWIGRFKFIVNLFGRLILDSVQPDRRKKLKTFPLWEPSYKEIGADILQRFEQHQEELKRVIESTSDLLDREALISSPANKNIVYKLETAYDIIITHERRHFEQAKEILHARVRS